MTSQRHHELPTTTLNLLSNSFTILIVDDLKANRILLERLLDRVGYRTVEAEDGLSALKQIKATRPDLLILDVEMPRMDGIEAVTSLRASEGPGEHLPTIVASGNASDEMKAHALAAGADVFLKKPFDLIELIAAIRDLLRGRKSHTAPKRRGGSNHEGNRTPANTLAMDLAVKN